MSALWKPEQRDGWAYLPSRERERFIEKLRRARRRAPSDIVNFIKEIFQGRPAIKSRQLFGFAIAHGFGRSTIRKALNALGYRYRAGSRAKNRAAKWLNPDRDWERYFPAVSDLELSKAGAGQANANDVAKPIFD